MPIEAVRVSEKAKDQLSRLKRHTQIKHWNVLCRWALCISLSEDSEPVEPDAFVESNVEMTWKTFAGETGDLLWLAVARRCDARGLGRDTDTVAGQFRLHLHRGIAYLSADKGLRSIDALIAKAAP